MPHAFVYQGNVYGPSGPITDMEGTPLDAKDADAYNAALTKQELAYWATAPDTFPLAYFTFAEPTPVFGRQGRPHRPDFYPSLTDSKITTWTGAVLGRITAAHVFRHNVGGRMIALTVQGTNGAAYHGRASWDWGQAVRLRKAGRS